LSLRFNPILHLRALLENGSLVGTLVITNLFGDCEVLIRLCGSAQTLLSLGEEIVHVVVLRIQFNRTLEDSGSHLRIVALEGDLTQQDVGAG
jgi:hypothetical protein